MLGRGRHGLQRDLERITVHAIPQVEELNADLRVGEEQLADVALAQILADGVIICEVAVVDQGLIQADEGMRAAGMPDASLGGIALMSDPDVRRLLFKPVVSHYLFGIAHDFQHRQISPVAQNKGALFAEAGVERILSLYEF